MSPRIPDGFEPFDSKNAFDRLIAPYYRRVEEDGAATYGFWTSEGHANANGVIHGGMFMSFADVIMGYTAQEISQRTTASIQIDYHFVSGLQPGRWVEGQAFVTRATNHLCFMRAVLTSDGATVITADGLWKLFKPLSEVRQGVGPDSERDGV